MEYVDAPLATPIAPYVAIFIATTVYCADAVSKWHHLLKMAAAVLRCMRFTLL